MNVLKISRTTYALILLCTCLLAAPANSSEGDLAKHTFVFVHGSTGGAWDWKEVAGLLEGEGHEVYRVTLTGLGEREHLASKDVNLSTHIADVVNTIVYEELEQIVLVGHSYGGMVISGVMNQIPERIKHATFLDAGVPDHGMSTVDVYALKPSELNVVDGLIYLPWLDESSEPPHDVPHPLNTYLEKVSFDNPLALTIDTTFVAFVPEGVSKEQRADDPSWRRAEKRGWTIRTFDGDHVIYREKPKEFVGMLLDTTKDKNKKP